MPIIHQNISLKSYNTFGLEVIAKGFTEVNSTEELVALLDTSEWKECAKKLVLGGGSNVLLRSDFDGLVVLNRIKGIRIVEENEHYVLVQAGGGENWHSFVQYAIQKDWGGIENLSLIPGTVGAAPMQNIGAYGVEIKDVFHSLEAVELATGKVKTFDAEECAFGYRESVFKHDLKDKYVIANVTFRLTKGEHKLSLDYGAIKNTLSEKKIEHPTISDVSEAVVEIRQSKLPDPKEIGNSGSFFKNPTITRAAFEKLKAIYPDMPGYPVSDAETKVPAGWLIEKAGWKGYKEGSIGVHPKQALVLVNYGGAQGSAIEKLAYKIQDSVEEQFGIRLNPEVNFI